MHLSTAFDRFLMNSSLLNLNTEPTYGNCTLDLLLCNDQTLISDWKVLPNFSTSDHCSKNFDISCEFSEMTMSSRLDFCKTNWEQANLMLLEMDWDSYYQNCHHIDEIYDAFLAFLVCN